MNFLAILLLAIAMAADAFAVSVAHGARMRTMRWLEAFKIALVFGFMQGLMPVVGWFIGRGAAQWVEQWGHWIAFVLLMGVALKMLYEVWRPDGLDYEGIAKDIAGISHWELLVAGIATSIDALAAGVGLAFVKLSIYEAATLIAVCTFFLSALGVWLGRVIGGKLGKGAEILGAAILIVLAFNFLIAG